MNNHTVNVMSQIAETSTQSKDPYVGMPVTKNYYTDRRAATITVVKGNTITVQENEVETVNYYAGKYKVLPALIQGEKIFTKRKNGRWVAQGQDLNTGLGLSLGVHDHFIDPTF